MTEHPDGELGWDYWCRTGDFPDCSAPGCDQVVMGNIVWEGEKAYHRRCHVGMVLRQTYQRVQAPPDPRQPAQVNASAMSTAHILFQDYLEAHNDGSGTLADAVLEAVYGYEWAKLNAHTDPRGFTAYPSLQDARAALAAWRDRTKPREEV